MKVRELITELLAMPMEQDVFIEVDDDKEYPIEVEVENWIWSSTHRVLIKISTEN